MAKNYNIMVVDDDKLLGSLVCQSLDKLADFKTHFFEDPTKAIKNVPKLKPDMIILDWSMPELSGLHFLLQIRRDIKTKNMPVFMLTGKTQGADFEVACEAGVDGYMTKPVDFNMLNQRVVKYLAKT